MTLSLFLNGLFQEGNVVVKEELFEFEPEDLEQSKQILLQKYQISILEMPSPPPEFHGDMAVWAAKFLYRAIQFVMLRNLNEEDLKTWLLIFEGKISAEMHYSADLSLCYLPTVLNFAKGLAPDDPLLELLNNILEQFPFSSEKIENSAVALESINTILTHSSLKIAYLDKIIAKKNPEKIQHIPDLEASVKEALGNHTHKFWEDFAKTTK